MTRIKQNVNFKTLLSSFIVLIFILTFTSPIVGSEQSQEPIGNINSDIDQPNPRGSRSILDWKYEIAEDSYISTPALVDLNNNGDLEVVFLSDADVVYALSSAGDFMWKNTNYTIARADQFMTGTGSDTYYRTPFFSSITPADITGDNNFELLFGAKNNVVCLDNKGDEVWAVSETNGDYISTPVVTDLADGGNLKKDEKDILVLRDNSFSDITPEVYSTTGERIWALEGPGFGSEVGFASASTSDMDSAAEPDSWQDILFGNHYSPLRLYSYINEEYTRVTPSNIFLNVMIYGTGALGDFVGDSEYEYFIGSYEAGATNLVLPL
jgi:hypothetical protein